MRAANFRSAYVPHDLEQPLVGSDSGPLAGLSVVVKDMYDIAGERAGGGSPAWLEAHEPATTHSAIVDRILSAGGTITGKTVCDEFFYSITGDNFHYGTPLNPRAPDSIPGGSSSGSASACAAGSCDIAIGSDTAGSVRVPAALCGVYGIRVSRGRMDMRGAISMAPSFDAGGWFASSAGLFRRAGQALLENYQPAPSEIRRMVVLDDAFRNIDPRIAELLRDFLSRIARVLPETGASTVAGEDIDRWRETMRLTQAAEVWQNFGKLISHTDLPLGPGIAERMKIASSVDDAQVRAGRIVLDEATERMSSATADETVLILPTCPSVAPLLSSSPAQFEAFRVKTMRLVCMASISGLPQITVPIGCMGGSPVGLSFLGWKNGEEALLDLAVRLSPYVGFNVEAA